MDSDKVSLITISTEVSAGDKIQGATSNAAKNESTSKIKTIKTSDSRQDAKSGKVTAGVATPIDEAAEERQRNGRYLAVGVTLVFVFIAFYHTVLRHATVLAGLLAPAVIMLLYILWLLYFAKKKKMQGPCGPPKASESHYCILILGDFGGGLIFNVFAITFAIYNASAISE